MCVYVHTLFIANEKGTYFTLKYYVKGNHERNDIANFNCLKGL